MRYISLQSVVKHQLQASVSSLSYFGGFIFYFLLYFSLLNINVAHSNPAVSAAKLPVVFSSKYEVSKGVITIGTTLRSLKKHKDGSYVFESITKPSGMAKLFTSGKIRESSKWKWHDNELIPQLYQYKNSGNTKREVQLDFDWDANEVTNTINGDPWTMNIEDGTLDKLLYQLKLMYDLQQGETRFIYKVADGGKLKTYEIKVVGEKTIEIELGKFNTVVVQYQRNSRTTTMWCAKELQFFPVRIEQQKEDDSAVTADLVKITGIKVPESVKVIKKK